MAKALVAFFSASGTTKRVAKKLASAAGADLHEIVPAEIYTNADLNWMNDKSRSSVEMADKSNRPGIASNIENISDYDTIFVGFPIWWYREPSIIDTFMEKYDFSGKTVVPFATSGGSGLGGSSKNMQSLAKGAKVLQGRKLSASASDKELADWVKNLI